VSLTCDRGLKWSALIARLADIGTLTMQKYLFIDEATIILKVHDDGDLTVKDQGKVSVVTTEGKQFR